MFILLLALLCQQNCCEVNYLAVFKRIKLKEMAYAVKLSC